MNIRSKIGDPCNLAMALSICFAFLMLLGKTIAYLITGSTAILSDAAESIAHLLTVSLATFSLWYSRLPADKNHRYGHGKIAYFSAAGEAFVILGTAISIFVIAFRALFNPIKLEQLPFGLAIITILGIVNSLLGKYLIYTGKKHHSFVLVASGKHVLADMWSSFGIVAGVAVVQITGYLWLDPLIAIAVALNITWIALSLLKQSYQGLMEEIDKSTTAKISSLLNRAIAENHILSYHQLRHRKVNERLWVEVHLVFNENLTVKEAHRRASLIEITIMKAFPQEKLYITTHFEPDPHEISHPKEHPELSNMF